MEGQKGTPLNTTHQYLYSYVNNYNRMEIKRDYLGHYFGVGNITDPTKKLIIKEHPNCYSEWITNEYSLIEAGETDALAYLKGMKPKNGFSFDIWRLHLTEVGLERADRFMFCPFCSQITTWRGVIRHIDWKHQDELPNLENTHPELYRWFKNIDSNTAEKIRERTSLGSWAYQIEIRHRRMDGFWCVGVKDFETLMRIMCCQNITELRENLDCSFEGCCDYKEVLEGEIEGSMKRLMGGKE